MGFSSAVDQSFTAAVAKLEQASAEVIEISAPHFEYATAAYYLILPAEASSNLAKFDSVRFGMRADVAGTVEDVMSATRGAGFGPEVGSGASSSAPMRSRPGTTTRTTAVRRRCAR